MKQFLPILKCLNVIGLTQKIDIFDKIISEDHSGIKISRFNFWIFLTIKVKLVDYIIYLKRIKN